VSHTIATPRTIATLAITVTLALTGCSKHNDERGKGDAPVANKRGDDSPATVVNFPDGFMNVAFKCLGPNGIYAHTRAASPVVIKDDPNCETERAPG